MRWTAQKAWMWFTTMWWFYLSMVFAVEGLWVTYQVVNHKTPRGLLWIVPVLAFFSWSFYTVFKLRRKKANQPKSA